MLETEKKKTNIIVITDYSEYGDTAVRYSAILAAIFKSSLLIVDKIKRHVNVHDESNCFRETIKSLEANGINYSIVEKEFSYKELYAYAEEVSAIMFVIAVSPKRGLSLFTKRQAAGFIKPSRVPVMTVGNRMPATNVFRNVILPLDIDRQSKEKALWAGYFSRYYCAMVHILFTTYKDSLLRKRVRENVAFTEKLYGNLEVKYELHEMTPTIDNIDKYSLSFASQVGATLTVIMMTKYYSLIDLIFGPKEFSLIGNKDNFPVLCINEREDLYVLCT